MTTGGCADASLQLVLDFLASKGLHSAAATLREEVSSVGLPPGSCSNLERLVTDGGAPLGDLDPLATDGLTFPGAEAGGASSFRFHDVKADPPEDAWDDDEDVGYERLPAPDDMLGHGFSQPASPASSCERPGFETYKRIVATSSPLLCAPPVGFDAIPTIQMPSAFPRTGSGGSLKGPQRSGRSSALDVSPPPSHPRSTAGSTPFSPRRPMPKGAEGDSEEDEEDEEEEDEDDDDDDEDEDEEEGEGEGEEAHGVESEGGSSRGGGAGSEEDGLPSPEGVGWAVKGAGGDEEEATASALAASMQRMLAIRGAEAGGRSARRGQSSAAECDARSAAKTDVHTSGIRDDDDDEEEGAMEHPASQRVSCSGPVTLSGYGPGSSNPSSGPGSGIASRGGSAAGYRSDLSSQPVSPGSTVGFKVEPPLPSRLDR